MLRMIIRTVCVAALLLPSATIVSAQAWLGDRARREGPGFRVGNLELHPGIGVEGGYDSNVFMSDEPVGSAIFRITPHFDVSTLGEQRREDGGEERTQAPKVQFRAGVAAPIYVFLEDQARNDVGINGDLELSILPDGPVTFSVYDRFSRRVRPFTESGAGNDFGRITNVAGGNLRFQTRGGVFSSNLGYDLTWQFFENDAFDFGNALIHRAEAGANFRFLPHTTLFYDFTADFTNYQDPSVLRVSDNVRVRNRVGLNGALTPRLSALVAVGYGAVLVDDPTLRDFDTVIAQAELRLKLSPTTKLTFGYERDFLGSVIGNWRTRDRGYLNFQWLLGGSFLLGFDSWVGYLKFGTIVDSSGAPITVDGSTERSDVMVNLSLFAEYRFTDWLALNATVGYTGDFTDFEYDRLIGMSPVVDPADFSKFQAWLGVRVFY